MVFDKKKDNRDMEKLDLLIAVIYQVICENKLVMGYIERLKRGEHISNIDISGTTGSGWSSQMGTIKINVSDIIGCYNLSQKYGINPVDSFSFNPNYLIPFWGYDNSNYITVDCPNADKILVKEELEKSDFLNLEDQNVMSKYDTFTINSMSYVLYHEIGHAIYDKTTENQRERECKADIFAFDAIKSMYKNDDIEVNNAGFLGAFIGISYILSIRKPKDEIADKEHPHTIERLYHLLNYWGIKDNSCYWELAYNAVRDWSRKNGLDVSLWEKEASESYKDKFIDAYMYFRKTT